MGLETLGPVLGIGSKLFGAGGAQAAPAANTGPSPFTAGLLGQQPPPPEPNPAFHAGGDGLAQPILDDPYQAYLDKQTANEIAARNPTAQNISVAGQPVESGSPSPGLLSSAPPQRAAQARAITTPGLMDYVPGELDTMNNATPAPVEHAQAIPAVTAQAKPAGDPRGLFGDIQNTLGDAPYNPMFQAGMGLLASGYDRNVNPYLAVNKNLGGIPALQIAALGADQRARAAQLDEALQKGQITEAQHLAALMALRQNPQGGASANGPAVARGQATYIR